MSIWKIEPVLEKINSMSKNTMMEQLNINFEEYGDDYITATMPVNHKTHQPLGLLHGGASVALAETLGSVASHLIIDNSKYFCVGLEINANHVRSKMAGIVTGTAKPIHLGSKTHLWEIRIVDEHNKLICISRLTMAILENK